MNSASLLVLAAVIAVLAGAVSVLWRSRGKGGCEGCRRRDSCANTINCTFDEDGERK